MRYVHEIVTGSGSGPPHAVSRHAARTTRESRPGRRCARSTSPILADRAHAGPPSAHERARQWVRSGMASPQDPDRIDPTDQSGRPVLVTGAVVALMVVLALMVIVYVLAI